MKGEKISRREFIKRLIGIGVGSLLLPEIIGARREGRGVIVTRRECMFYRRLGDNIVQCMHCPHGCVLRPGERSFCRVKENVGGKLYTLVYANPTSVHIDPIEKKPFFHFMPQRRALSIGTAGCNFRCIYCQNWQISQRKPEETINVEIWPEEMVRIAREYGTPIIAYTYNEPIIFYEYNYEIARLAKRYGIRNVYVTNAYINEEPLESIAPYLDGATITLKWIDEDAYWKYSHGRLNEVQRAIKHMWGLGIHIELINLVVPTLNDDMGKVRRLVRWIRDEISPEVPLHLLRFYPHYKLRNLPPTPMETLKRAREVAIEEGMYYVYLGNVPPGDPTTWTYCPKCKKVLIKREGYLIRENKIRDGKCPYCGAKIYGVWG